MDLSANSPDPGRYPFDATILPNFSFLEQYHLLPSQPVPDTQQPDVAPSPSSLPRYHTQGHPPLPVSSHSLFPPTVGHISQTISPANPWPQTPVTCSANDSSFNDSSHMANAAIGTMFSAPVVENIAPLQYEHAEFRAVHPTFAPEFAPKGASVTPQFLPATTLPSNALGLTLLPGGTTTLTTPPFPSITLPGISASGPLAVSSGTAREAVHQSATAPVKKTRAKRGKRVPSTKRTRPKSSPPSASKHPSPAVNPKGMASSRAATQNASQVPITQSPTARGQTTRQCDVLGAQNEARPFPSDTRQEWAPSLGQPVPQASAQGASQSEKRRSPTHSVGSDVNFHAPRPRQEPCGLNFADIVLAQNSYPVDSTPYRYAMWKKALGAREMTSSGADAATKGDAIPSRKELSKAPNPGAAAVPRPVPGKSVRGNAGTYSKKGRASERRSSECSSRLKPTEARCGRPQSNQLGASRPAKGKGRDLPESSSATPVQGSSSQAVTNVAPGRREAPSGPKWSPTGNQGAANFGGKVTNINPNRRDNHTANESDDKAFCRAKDRSMVRALSTLTTGGSSSKRCPDQEQVEEAVQYLMTISATSRRQATTPTVTLQPPEDELSDGRVGHQEHAHEASSGLNMAGTLAETPTGATLQASACDAGCEMQTVDSRELIGQAGRVTVGFAVPDASERAHASRSNEEEGEIGMNAEPPRNGRSGRAGHCNGKGTMKNSSSKKVAHLKRIDPNKKNGMNLHCEMQTEQNFENVFGQHNRSQRACSGTIPATPFSSMTETPQSPLRQTTAAAMPSRRLPAECTESTPVDIRDSRDFFTRPSVAPKPQISHNRSFTQETGLWDEYLISPQQVQQLVLPHPPLGCPAQGLVSIQPNPAPSITRQQHPQHSVQVARPLFQEAPVNQSLVGHPHSHAPLAAPQLQRQRFTTPTPVFQQLYPLQASSSLSIPHNPLPSNNDICTQQPLPPVPVSVPDTIQKAASMPQPTKRTTKKRAPRKTSVPSKALTPGKRVTTGAAKIAKPKRPRAPRKPVAKAPSVTFGAPTNATDPTQNTNATRPATLSHPSATESTTPTVPCLRLRANLGSKGATEPPTAASIPLSTAIYEQQGTKQQSAPAQMNGGVVCNFSSAPPQVQAPNAATAPSEPRLAQPRPKGVAGPKRMKPANQKPCKTSTKTSRATIGEALKAAKKAARSKQNSVSLANAAAMDPLQPQPPQQIVNLRAPLPPAPLRTATSPVGVKQADGATSVQYSTPPKTFELRAGFHGSNQAPSDHANLPPSQGRLSEVEARERNEVHHRLQISVEPSRENRDASSPRTESTQQTLPPDGSGSIPSDFYNSSESDDIPLARTKRRTRPTSNVILRPPDSRPATISRENTQQQRVSPIVPQQLLPTCPRRRKHGAPAACTARPQVSTIANAQVSSQKRQKCLKNTDGNKRRKKNPASRAEQNQSTGSKKSSKVSEVPRTGKEAGQDAAVQPEEQLATEPERTTSPKKSGTRGQTKGKTARHSAPVHRRPASGTKTQTKEKSKRKASQSKCTEASPSTTSADKLRLCLSVRENDGGNAPTAGARASRDSCGSAITLDGVGDQSRSPQKPGNRSRKGSLGSNSNVGDEKSQTAPCFAAELRNLRSSGVLRTGEQIFSPVSSGDFDSDFRDIRKVLCILCQKHGPHNEMVKHPCFPVRAFDVCKSCAHSVSKRVEEHGAKRKNAVVSSADAVTQRTTLFVMLMEDMVRHFSPSDREHRDVQRIYEFINNRDWKEMVARAESLCLPLDMLTVLRVTLRKVGFTVRAGRLRWPVGDFSLPLFEDTRALVAHAVPARIDDLRKGILPGESAWNQTFGKKGKLKLHFSSCAIYEKLFGLIGLRLSHTTECKARSSSDPCKVKFEAVSVGVVMYRAAAMLSGTVTRDLLAACWTKDEAFRFIDETEIELANESFVGDLKSCCICGGSDKAQNESCSFRYTNCVECLKSFCSICLLNVLGTSEYLRSFGDDGYCCIMCRLHKNAELCPTGRPNGGEQDRRLRLHDIGGIRKRKERRMKPMPPLLLLSPSVRADVLRLQPYETSKAIGIAKFCEVANDNNVRNSMESKCTQASHDICLSCKLSAEGEEEDGNGSEVLTCGHEGCINVMHKTCLPPQRQSRRRGFRSKWSCPHHQCSKCEQRDETKLLRCRTCPTTYCKDHMPLPSEVYVFSEKSFACSSCRSFLRVPQMLRLKPQGSKSERKRSQIAQALAINQRKRFAVVKKLSEAPDHSEVATPSLIKVRRDFEL